MQTGVKWIDKLYAIVSGITENKEDDSSYDELKLMAKDADKYHELRNEIMQNRLKDMEMLLSRAIGRGSHLYLGEPIRVKTNTGEAYVWCLGLNDNGELYASDGTNRWYKVEGSKEDYNIIEAIFKQLPTLLKQALK